MPKYNWYNETCLGFCNLHYHSHNLIVHGYFLISKWQRCFCLNDILVVSLRMRFITYLLEL